MAFIGIKAMCTARGICRSFYPSLLPERRYLAHRDFLHFFPWLDSCNDLSAARFVRVDVVPHSDMAVFRCVRPVAERGFPQTMNGFSAEEVAAAFDWAEQHVSPGKRDTIVAARAMAYLHRGEVEAGKRLVESALAGEHSNSAAFQQLKEFTTRFDLVHWGVMPMISGTAESGSTAIPLE